MTTLSLLQLVSPALPVGAFSYSEGLESLIQSGALKDEQEVEHWLNAELQQGALRFEAAALSHLAEDLLQPGDRLMDGEMTLQVEVIAASEPLLRVSAVTLLELLQAAYHLGNRHVALELHEQELFLPDDAVLASMLRSRGLKVSSCNRAFLPEGGAYGGGHSHGHGVASR